MVRKNVKYGAMSFVMKEGRVYRGAGVRVRGRAVGVAVREISR